MVRVLLEADAVSGSLGVGGSSTRPASSASLRTRVAGSSWLVRRVYEVRCQDQSIARVNVANSNASPSWPLGGKEPDPATARPRRSRSRRRGEPAHWANRVPSVRSCGSAGLGSRCLPVGSAEQEPVQWRAAGCSCQWAPTRPPRGSAGSRDVEHPQFLAGLFEPVDGEPLGITGSVFPPTSRCRRPPA